MELKISKGQRERLSHIRQRYYANQGVSDISAIACRYYLADVGYLLELLGVGKDVECVTGFCDWCGENHTLARHVRHSDMRMVALCEMCLRTMLRVVFE